MSANSIAGVECIFVQIELLVDFIDLLRNIICNSNSTAFETKDHIYSGSNKTSRSLIYYCIQYGKHEGFHTA